MSRGVSIQWTAISTANSFITKKNKLYSFVAKYNSNNPDVLHQKEGRKGVECFLFRFFFLSFIGEKKSVTDIGHVRLSIIPTCVSVALTRDRGDRLTLEEQRYVSYSMVP